MRVFTFDDAKKYGPLYRLLKPGFLFADRNSPTVLYTILHSINQRTQVDHSSKYPVARVPNDSYTILFIDHALSSPGSDRRMRHVSIGRGGATTRARTVSGRPSFRERSAWRSVARDFLGVVTYVADYRGVFCLLVFSRFSRDSRTQASGRKKCTRSRGGYYGQRRI